MPDTHLPFGTVTLGTVFSGAGLVAIITLIIRQLGPWRKQASEEREADFARIRSESAEAKVEAKAASAAVQRLENIVACMRPAISILTAEVRRLDPNNATNAAILQVQELMAMAAAGDMGLGKGLIDLATAKGAGE